MPGIRMSATTQDALARLAEPRKTLGVFERGGGEPRRLQQILCRVADRLVVVHDGDERPFGHFASRG
jgi:hypothetical protein